MYLISIYFDIDSDKKLKSYIKHVAKATGNSFMLDNNVPPHITVAAVETKQEDVVISRVEELIKKLTCGEIKFVSVGSFASKVIYVQPVLNEYLHNLSVELSKDVGRILRTFKIKKNVEVTDNGKIII